MKNRLSRKTREQFAELLTQAYNEGFKDGQALSSNDSLDELLAAGKVKYIDTDFSYLHLTKGKVYEVFEKVIHPFENIPVLKVVDDRGSKNECSLIKPDTVHLFEAVKQPEQIPIAKEVTDELTPNEQRRELLHEAKQFMRSLQNSDGYFSLPTQYGRDIEVFASFKVDKENRTVTCRLKSRYQNFTCKLKTARCHPNDVFNDRLGKLVSLAMCLGLDVPQEFLNAVQPDDWAIGQIVTFHKEDSWYMEKNYRIDSITEKKGNLTKLFACNFGSKANAALTDGELHTLPIIDDTNAEYIV